MSRTLAERSVGERAGGGWAVAEWALGPLLSAPCELQPAPRSSEDAHVALWRHLLSLCCLFVFSLPFLLLPVPWPVLFHSSSAEGGVLTALPAAHRGHVWTHCLPRVGSNQPSPFVLFFLFSNTPGPDSLQKSELQPYSVQVWFQGQY